MALCSNSIAYLGAILLMALIRVEIRKWLISVQAHFEVFKRNEFDVLLMQIIFYKIFQNLKRLKIPY